MAEGPQAGVQPTGWQLGREAAGGTSVVSSAQHVTLGGSCMLQDTGGETLMGNVGHRKIVIGRFVGHFHRSVMRRRVHCTMSVCVRTK